LFDAAERLGRTFCARLIGPAGCRRRRARRVR
jgi:hypothetical protein